MLPILLVAANPFSSIIIGGLILILIVWTIRKMVRDKKSGGSSCGCSGCSGTCCGCAVSTDFKDNRAQAGSSASRPEPPSVH